MAFSINNATESGQLITRQANVNLAFPFLFPVEMGHFLKVMGAPFHRVRRLPPVAPHPKKFWNSKAHLLTMAEKKKRLDVAAQEKGLFESRQAAQTAIINGDVLVDGQKITKPGTAVATSALIELRPGFVTQKFVSRGGLKLEKALEEFGINTQDRICLDVGASTGGFTDCLIKRGAAKVYAIDVGYGQLDWSLRTSPKVVVVERTNVRYLQKDELYADNYKDEICEPGVLATLATIDCSFISLAKVLPATVSLLSDEEDIEIICLVKPQFEVGKGQVGKGGVVKDPQLHIKVLETVISDANSLGLNCFAITYSPIKGPKGNIEYLVALSKTGKQDHCPMPDLVKSAFERLSGDHSSHENQ